MIWIVILFWFSLQILSGYTFGSDQFPGLGGGVPIPKGRWLRLVHRDEEPAFFWTLIAVQVFLTLIYLATRSPADSHLMLSPEGLP